MKTVTKLEIASLNNEFQVWNEATEEFTTITAETTPEVMAIVTKRLGVHPDLIETLRSNFESNNDHLVEDLTDLWKRQNELEARIRKLEKIQGV